MDLSDGFTKKKNIVDLKSVVSLLFAFLLAYCLTSTDVFRGFVILIVWFSIVLSVCCFVCHSDLLSYFLCFLFNGLSLCRLACLTFFTFRRMFSERSEFDTKADRWRRRRKVFIFRRFSRSQA